MNYPALDVAGWSRQSAELRELFQREMYGWIPPVANLERNGKGQLVGPQGLSIDVLEAKPNPSPGVTFVALNFDGNDSVRQQTGAWPIDRIVESGNALLTFAASDVVPDDPLEAPERLAKLGQGKPIATIAAWAWALISVAKTVEGPVVFVGHSRMGKAALLASAFSGYSVASIQSGCGGAAPSRTEVGETVGQITERFPHWFLPAFARYAGRETELPFDQHAVIALCAPSSVLILNADDDHWANPQGQEAMVDLARPVFAASQASHRLETWSRPGGHSVTSEDWDRILQHAWLT